jgi:cohesin complex subunit SA-1/2
MVLAVAELVNCILSAAGCDQHVTEDDINDPDNLSNKLTELQELYEEVGHQEMENGMRSLQRGIG